jgi:hypothetical protein
VRREHPQVLHGGAIVSYRSRGTLDCMDLDYFGSSVDASTLEGLLRTAVMHTPATTDRDLAFDPDAWTSGLLDRLAGTPLAARAGEVLTAMVRTGTASELRFAAQHDAGRDLVAPDVLLDALDRASDPPTRASLARSLARAIRTGRLAYTPRLRAVLGEHGVQDELLGAIVLHDHAAFLAALAAIFGEAAPAARRYALCAATGLNHDELTRLRDELAASSLIDDIRAVTTAALDEVLAHPATAKRTGPARW